MQGRPAPRGASCKMHCFELQIMFPNQTLLEAAILWSGEGTMLLAAGRLKS